jgi:hypothetical protein
MTQPGDEPNPRGLELSLRGVVSLTARTTDITLIEFLEPHHPPRAKFLIRIQSLHCIVSVRISGCGAADPGPETFKKSLGTCKGLLDQARVFGILVTKIPEQSEKAAQLSKAVISLSVMKPKLEGGDIRKAPGTPIVRRKFRWKEELE